MVKLSVTFVTLCNPSYAQSVACASVISDELGEQEFLHMD